MLTIKCVATENTKIWHPAQIKFITNDYEMAKYARFAYRGRIIVRYSIRIGIFLFKKTPMKNHRVSDYRDLSRHSRHYRRLRKPQFTYLARGPLYYSRIRVNNNISYQLVFIVYFYQVYTTFGK